VSPFELRYLRGGCLDYAEAILDVWGGTIYAVSVNGEIHHFVVKRELDTGYMNQRGAVIYQDVVGQHTKQEVLDTWGEVLGGRATMRKARKSDFVGFETDDENVKDAVRHLGGEVDEGEDEDGEDEDGEDEEEE
jgi:hypothetical protein